jgi:tRNA (pseudouridine54-N1)-methyltransferase
MRQFVIVGHDAPTTPEFSLDALPGAGRLDLLARCVTSSLLLSHGIRTDVRTHLVLDDEYTVTVDGASVKRLNPDERSTAALVRGALEQREEAVGRMPVETSPGVSLTRGGLEPTLDAIASDGTVVTLHENGDPVASSDPVEDPIFVLSDHHEFTDQDRSTVQDHSDQKLSVGPEPLHADQAITVAHNWLDTDGFTDYS